MCYHCATNPSIHHHCCHIAAVSSPLSHHGVAFMSVAVLSLPSWCHLHRHIVAVLSSPSCRCSAFCYAWTLGTFLLACGAWTAYCTDMGSCECGLPFLEPSDLFLVSFRTSDGGLAIREEGQCSDTRNTSICMYDSLQHRWH